MAVWTKIRCVSGVGDLGRMDRDNNVNSVVLFAVSKSAREQQEAEGFYAWALSGGNLMNDLNVSGTSDVTIPTVAVPALRAYSPKTGIGRHITSLIRSWGDRCRVLNAQYVRSPLPLLRSYPLRAIVPRDTDILLIPQITGAQILKHIRGCPSIVVVHDVGIVDCEQDIKETDWITKLAVMGSFRSLRYASRIVVPSEFTASRLALYLPEVATRVSVVKCGVWPSDSRLPSPWESRVAIEHRRGKRLGHPLLIYVGTERPRKNFPFVLQLLKKLKSKFPDIMLLKIGHAGNELYRRRTMDELSALHLHEDEDILFLDDVSDDLLSMAYRASDVCVLPSLYEGFGLPAAEALMLGCPVIVAKGHAMEETVKGYADALPLELNTWAEKVGHLCSGTKQRQRLPLPNYNWDRTADQYLEIIKVEVGQWRAKRKLP